MKTQNTGYPLNFQFDQNPHILIVRASFYEDIANLQLDGVKAVLDRVPVTYEIVDVPGSLEIPAAILYAVKGLDFDPSRRRYDGFIALGCIIKGETIHDTIVATESARSLQELTNRYVLAIGNGILTCSSVDQARERADKSKHDRAGAAAYACLRLIELKHQFKLTSKRRWVAR